MDERASWDGVRTRARAAGLRVVEGVALPPPVLAVQGAGGLSLRCGLGARARWALLAMALARHRADAAGADVFLAGADGGRWLLGGGPVPLLELAV